MGRNHPVIRSQYFCEEIDAGLFHVQFRRLALIQGNYCLKYREPNYWEPAAIPLAILNSPGRTRNINPIRLWFLLILSIRLPFYLDVAGQDEARMSSSDLPSTPRKRDSTALFHRQHRPAPPSKRSGSPPIV